MSYNTVLKLHCAGGPPEFEDAMLLAAALLTTNLMPTHTTFGPLLTAAQKYGRHEQVLHIWRHVRSLGLEVDMDDDCALMIIGAAAHAGSCGAAPST